MQTELKNGSLLSQSQRKLVPSAIKCKTCLDVIRFRYFSKLYSSIKIVLKDFLENQRLKNSNMSNNKILCTEEISRRRRRAKEKRI